MYSSARSGTVSVQASQLDQVETESLDPGKYLLQSPTVEMTRENRLPCGLSDVQVVERAQHSLPQQASDADRVTHGRHVVRLTPK